MEYNDVFLFFERRSYKSSQLFLLQCEVVPSFETLTLHISMSADSGDIFQGEQLRRLVTKTGLCDNILKTSLLDFYAKCGMLVSSVHLFNEISLTNSIAWSAMMSGFIHNGYFKEAVELFQYVLALGIEPSAEILRIVTYSHMGALQLGKGIHTYLIRNSFYNSNEDFTALETPILNMYIRCGNISLAKICFDRMVGKDLVTWTSMIEGYGTHGLGFKSLDLLLFHFLCRFCAHIFISRTLPLLLLIIFIYVRKKIPQY